MGGGGQGAVVRQNAASPGPSLLFLDLTLRRGRETEGLRLPFKGACAGHQHPFSSFQVQVTLSVQLSHSRSSSVPSLASPVLPAQHTSPQPQWPLFSAWGLSPQTTVLAYLMSCVPAYLAQPWYMQSKRM